MMTADDDDGAVTVSRYRILQNHAALKSRPALASDDAVEIRGLQQA